MSKLTFEPLIDLMLISELGLPAGTISTIIKNCDSLQVNHAVASRSEAEPQVTQLALMWMPICDKIALCDLEAEASANTYGCP